MTKYLPFLFLASLLSCSEKVAKEPFVKQIKNEVWSVKDVDGEFQKDKITFLETYEYDAEGIEIGHLIYTPDGNLAGKELSVFDDKYENPVGTKYYSAEDSLLSYYSLKYNDKDEKISRWGFDAETDELLRMEEFSYDDQGNMELKKVLDASNVLQRLYEFDHDEYGNEISMIVRDPDGTERIREEYRITKIDKDHKWLENWGWRGDQPISYRTRTFVYSE